MSDCFMEWLEQTYAEAIVEYEDMRDFPVVDEAEVSYLNGKVDTLADVIMRYNREV